MRAPGHQNDLFARNRASRELPTDAFLFAPAVSLPLAEVAQRRLADLRELTQRYAVSRANVILGPGRSEEQLETLDRLYRGNLKEFSHLFQQKPELLQELYDLARETQDRITTGQISQEFLERGRKAGLELGRFPEWSKFESARNAMQSRLSSLNQQLGGLFARCLPQSHSVIFQAEQSQPCPCPLSQELVATFERGVKDGLQQYLEADQVAAKLAVSLRLEKSGALSLPRSTRLPEAIIATENKSPEFKALVARAFEDRTKVSLDQALTFTFRKSALIRAHHAMCSCEAGVALALSLDQALSLASSSQRGNAVINLLTKAWPEDLKHVDSQFAAQVAHEKNLPALRNKLKSRLDLLDAHLAGAIIDGDAPTALACRLRKFITGESSPAKNIRFVFREIHSAQASHSVIAKYQELFGSELVIALQRLLAPGPARDLSLAILSGDQNRIHAAEIYCALKIREDWLAAPFLSQPNEKRAQLIQDYESVYHKGKPGSFAKDLRVAVWQEDYGFLHKLPLICRWLDKTPFPNNSSYPFIRKIIRDGRLTEAEMLRYFIEGLGSDAEGIRTVLRDRPKSEIDRISAAYAELYPIGKQTRFFRQIPLIRRFLRSGDLRTDILSELSGKDRFDVAAMLNGAPDTPAAIISLIRDRLEYERGRGIIRWLLESRLTPKRYRYALASAKDDSVRAERLFAHQEKSPQELAFGAQLRSFQVIRLAEHGLEQIRLLKLKLSRIVAKVATWGGALAGGALAFQLHDPAAVMVLGGALIGKIGSRWLIRRSIERAHYSLEDGFWDVTRDCIDSAGFFFFATGRLGAAVFSVIGKIAGETISKKLVRQGMKLSLGRAMGSIESFFRHQQRLSKIVCATKSLGIGAATESYALNSRIIVNPANDSAEDAQLAGIRDALVGALFRR